MREEQARDWRPTRTVRTDTEYGLLDSSAFIVVIHSESSPAATAPILMLARISACDKIHLFDVEPYASLTAEDISHRLMLSRRQGTIAAFIAARFTNHEIATMLGISASTVKNHAELVFLRLGVTRREDIRSRLFNILLDE